MFAWKAGKLLFTRKEPNVGFGILLSLFPVLRSLGEGGKKAKNFFNYMLPTHVWNRAF